MKELAGLKPPGCVVEHPERRQQRLTEENMAHAASTRSPGESPPMLARSGSVRTVSARVSSTGQAISRVGGAGFEPASSIAQRSCQMSHFRSSPNRDRNRQCLLASRAGPTLNTYGEDVGIDTFLIPSARGAGLRANATNGLVNHLLEQEFKRITVDPLADNDRADWGNPDHQE